MAAASAAYQKMPTPDEMAAAGFRPEDFDTEPFELWPENWPVWQVFCELSGQWRQAMGGPTALDYTPLFTRMDRLGLDDEGWNSLFSDIRVIESSALKQMATNT